MSAVIHVNYTLHDLPDPNDRTRIREVFESFGFAHTGNSDFAMKVQRSEAPARILNDVVPALEFVRALALERGARLELAFWIVEKQDGIPRHPVRTPVRSEAPAPSKAVGPVLPSWRFRRWFNGLARSVRDALA